jgi:hypothetical protein
LRLLLLLMRWCTASLSSNTRSSGVPAARSLPPQLPESMTSSATDFTSLFISFTRCCSGVGVDGFRFAFGTTSGGGTPGALPTPPPAPVAAPTGARSSAAPAAADPLPTTKSECMKAASAEPSNEVSVQTPVSRICSSVSSSTVASHTRKRVANSFPGSSGCSSRNPTCRGGRPHGGSNQAETLQGSPWVTPLGVKGG